MINSELPDLTTWYRVPDDADIPEDVPFALKSPVGGIEVTPPKRVPAFVNTSGARFTNLMGGYQYFTPIPIESPKERQRLPKERGSVIRDVTDSDGDTYKYLMLVADDEWAGLSDEGTFYEDVREWTIISWTPTEGSYNRERKCPECSTEGWDGIDLKRDSWSGCV